MSLSPTPSVPNPRGSLGVVPTPANLVNRKGVVKGGGTSGGGAGNKKWIPWLFLSPYILLTLIFFIYPVFYAMRLSLYQTSGPNARAWVGLGNFTFVLSDPDFRTAVINTIIFTFFSIAVQLPLS